jgi:hypothetical protein
MKGLTLWAKTNIPYSRVIAYHHPNSITWRWSLWISLNKRLLPYITPYRTNNGLQIVAQLLPFLRVDLLQQQHMWRTE